MDKLVAMFRALMSLANGRLGALFDKSGWLLMAPALVALYLADPALAATMVQWTAFAIAIAGVAVIVSRIVFPQISLSELIAWVKSGNIPAGIVCAAVVVFVGLLFLGIVMWAKA